MSLVQLGTPVPQANVKLVDVDALRSELKRQIEGEVRFDQISRALYSSDASVYQIQPLGVVIPKNRQDIIRVVEICGRFRCPITMRGGGAEGACGWGAMACSQTSQCGFVVRPSKGLDSR